MSIKLECVYLGPVNYLYMQCIAVSDAEKLPLWLTTVYSFDIIIISIDIFL